MLEERSWLLERREETQEERGLAIVGFMPILDRRLFVGFVVGFFWGVVRLRLGVEAFYQY